MARYPFKVHVAGSQTVRDNCGTDADAYVAAHPTLFPVPLEENTDIAYHGGITIRLIRGEVDSRQSMLTVLNALKQAMINRGATTGSAVWVKEQDSVTGDINPTTSISAAIPDPLGGADWTNHTPAIEF